MNERRIRSRFPKPFFLAISSAEKRPASIISRADSTRSRSIAFEGDRPVSSLKSRLNCRGLRNATRTMLEPTMARSNVLSRRRARLGYDRIPRPGPTTPRTATARPHDGDRHQYFGDHTSEVGAKIVRKQTPRTIYSCAHAGRCPYWSVDHEDAIFVGPDLRVAALHFFSVIPMGG
jgi:hypothetical protein